MISLLGPVFLPIFLVLLLAVSFRNRGKTLGFLSMWTFDPPGKSTANDARESVRFGFRSSRSSRRFAGEKNRWVTDGGFAPVCLFLISPPKFNIAPLKLTANAPENRGPLEKDIPYWKPSFLGAMLVLGRVAPQQMRIGKLLGPS